MREHHYLHTLILTTVVLMMASVDMATGLPGARSVSVSAETGDTDPVLFGEFEQTSGSIIGMYVSFSLDDSIISKYAINGVTLFESLSVGNATSLIVERKIDGPVARIDYNALEISIHDAPIGFMTLSVPQGADAQNVELRLNDSFESTTHENYIEFTSQNLTVSLIGSDMALSTPSENIVRINMTAGTTIALRAWPEEEMLSFSTNAAYQSMVDAIKAAYIGAEIMIQKHDSIFESDVLRYTGIDISISVTPGSVVSRVDYDTARPGDGRTLIYLLDTETLDQKKGVVVHYDGVEIDQSSALDDVLNPFDDGLAAEYLVLQSHGITYVFVSIPHFSAHTISILQPSDPFSGVPFFAIIAGLLVVAAATISLFRRDERR